MPTRSLRLAALLLTPLLTGCVYAPLDLGSLGSLGQPYEARLGEGSPEQKVLLLRIDGEITGHPKGSLLSSEPATTDQVRLALDRARKDDDVRAVLLRIDSPGGGVTASDLIYEELRRFRQETGKPIVAWLMDTAASGGYYVAQAADHVVACPTCVTGSIGVVAQFPNFAGLGEKIGVQVTALTSGPLKDVGSPFRSMRDEERALLQGLIDAMYARFVDVVAAGRARAGLSREQVLALADGRVFTAQQARSANLIDDLGYLDQALAALATLARLSDPLLVTYERRSLSGGPSTVYSAQAAGGGLRLLGEDGPVLETVGRVLPRSGPTLQYLWAPGR